MKKWCLAQIFNVIFAKKVSHGLDHAEKETAATIPWTAPSKRCRLFLCVFNQAACQPDFLWYILSKEAVMDISNILKAMGHPIRLKSWNSAVKADVCPQSGSLFWGFRANHFGAFKNPEECRIDHRWEKSFYMHCHVVREHIENLTQFLCKLSAQAALKERHCLPGPVNGNALKEKTITGK